jgi:hypothetical protein
MLKPDNCTFGAVWCPGLMVCVYLASRNFLVRPRHLARWGLIVLIAGGGILENPAASNTGSMSRTRWPEVVTTSNTLHTSRWVTLMDHSLMVAACLNGKSCVDVGLLGCDVMWTVSRYQWMGETYCLRLQSWRWRQYVSLKRRYKGKSRRPYNPEDEYWRLRRRENLILHMVKAVVSLYLLRHLFHFSTLIRLNIF